MSAAKRKKPAASPASAVRLMIPSRLGYEKIAMEAGGRLAEMAGFEASRKNDLCTAIAEACLNAMQHGNRFSARKSVEILFSLQQKKLIVEIYDRGHGLREKPPIPVLEKKLARQDAAGGWGIFLIERLVDAVEFGKTDRNGHYTRLVMYLGEKQQVV